MNKISQIDSLNKNTMRSSVNSYASFSQLGVSEKKALASIAEIVKNKRILDIGVGGGRTVGALLDLSKTYIGIDYIEEMVVACRKKFPGVRFETMDARSMKVFPDASFELIVFAWAGICMVDHDGRIAILKEIHRLLSPGGLFVFSTYNRNSCEHGRLFVFPNFEMTTKVFALARRTVEFCLHTVIGLCNRVRYKKQEISTPEYFIVNDKCHDYKTMLYYITLDEQRKQLMQVGFKLKHRVYNSAGAIIENDDGNIGDSMLFVVER
jgi:ubiquinone/menaquinone biosynthesis C-methylase UbiE